MDKAQLHAYEMAIGQLEAEIEERQIALKALRRIASQSAVMERHPAERGPSGDEAGNGHEAVLPSDREILEAVEAALNDPVGTARTYDALIGMLRDRGVDMGGFTRPDVKLRRTMGAVAEKKGWEQVRRGRHVAWVRRE